MEINAKIFCLICWGASKCESFFASFFHFPVNSKRGSEHGQHILTGFWIGKTVEKRSASSFQRIFQIQNPIHFDRVPGPFLRRTQKIRQKSFLQSKKTFLGGASKKWGKIILPQFLFKNFFFLGPKSVLYTFCTKKCNYKNKCIQYKIPPKTNVWEDLCEWIHHHHPYVFCCPSSRVVCVVT